jgi:predicted transport protein
MSTPESALATQLKNIETRTGKSLAELTQIVKASGLAKHGELVEMLKRDLKMGHGDANTLVHHVRQSAGPAAAGGAGASLGEIVAGYYSGPKAALRPIHDKVMSELKAFGEFEIAPKKTYLSLRRKKQFAMIGPATNTRVEVGLNMKGVTATDRLIALPPKGMCDYKVNLTGVEQVDAALIGWIRRAFDGAA